MNTIAWIHNRSAQSWTEGRWGAAAELALPSDARGLLLAEGVFETVLVLDGRPRLLQAHHRRWGEGALLLGLPLPPPLAAAEALVQEAIARSGIGTGAMRLNWCRGSGPRGLAAPDPDHERADGTLFWLQLSALAPAFGPVTVIISPTEVRQVSSLLSRCKSFGYGSALIARRQAYDASADDALLLSSNGDLCCATSANLLMQIDNHWHTPPVASGCLAGTMRQRALELGLAQDSCLCAGDLEHSTGALLLNSLGCRPIRRLGQAELPGPQGQEAVARAEQLWRRLLNGDDG